MAVKIRTKPALAEPPKEERSRQFDGGGRELHPKETYRFRTLHRDTRPDPAGPATARLIGTMSSSVTKDMIKAVYDEMLPAMNLTPYYTTGWHPLFKRHTALLRASESGDWKLAKNLTKQLWAAYVHIMKTGEWQPGVWGEHEPK